MADLPSSDAPPKPARELTIRAVLVAILVAALMGAAEPAVVLKIGYGPNMSLVSAFLGFIAISLIGLVTGTRGTRFENNLVQTAGSAGESIAFGVGVTMPAILILGFDLELTRVMLVAVLGGLLGILMMVPLRRALIVQQHGKLKYPEGTACAEVLKAGASQESRAAASQAALDMVRRTVWEIPVPPRSG